MLGLLAMSFDLVIQKILGHRSIKTTELYTHISGGAKNKVGSPLDFLGQQKDLTSDPGGTRTPNRQSRNLIFYPIELRSHKKTKINEFLF